MGRIASSGLARPVVVGFLLVVLSAQPAVAGRVAVSEPNGTVRATGQTTTLATVDNLEEKSDEFGGLIEATGALGFYRREDGAIAVVVPASGSSRFKAADALALGIPVVVETRDIERDEISRIQQLVSEVRWTPAAGVGPPVTLFHAETRRMFVYSDAPESAFADVSAAFPGKVEYRGQALGAASRLSDYAPFWGGARMVSPDDDPYYSQGNYCTSGFSVLTSVGYQRMVTASHCWELNWLIESPNGQWFGEVKKRQNYPSWDFELVGGFGIDHGPKIYTGGATGVETDVKSAGSTGFNVEYCFSGATDYESCNLFMDDDDFDYDYTGDGVTYDIQIFLGPPGSGACGGDSGSPFYRYVTGGVTIRGIVVAGAAFPNDPDLSICKANSEIVGIMKWSLIRDNYDVTIKTT